MAKLFRLVQDEFPPIFVGANGSAKESESSFQPLELQEQGYSWDDLIVSPKLRDDADLGC